MIIKYPTALYSTVIPILPSDKGNITFVISNTIPPRSSLLFTELPPAIEQQQRPPRTISPEVRRASVADRTFTVTSASQSAAASSKKTVELGQVLDFTDSVGSNLDPMLVADVNETQHDTNLLDFTSLNISTADQATITDNANKLFTQLNIDLNQIVILRQNIEIQISENQKSQNENKKATDAIQLLIDNGSSSLVPVINDLKSQAVILSQQAAEYVALANEYAASATTKRDQIRELAQVVR